MFRTLDLRFSVPPCQLSALEVDLWPAIIASKSFHKLSIELSHWISISTEKAYQKVHSFELIHPKFTQFYNWTGNSYDGEDSEYVSTTMFEFRSRVSLNKPISWSNLD